MKRAAPKHHESESVEEEREDATDEPLETDSAEPDATAPPAPAPAPAKISGEDLKAKLREERRVARKQEKGY